MSALGVYEERGTDQVGALRRAWGVLLVGALVAGALGLAVSSWMLPESYRATSTLIVVPVDDPEAAERNRSLEAYLPEQSVTETFAQLAGEPAMVASAAQALGLQPRLLDTTAAVRAVPRTPLLEISVTAPTAAEAARRTRGYTDTVLRSIRDAKWVPALSLDLVSQARTPTAPVSPQPVLTALVAAVAGLVLAACAVVLRTRVREGRHRDDPSLGTGGDTSELEVARTGAARAYWA